MATLSGSKESPVVAEKICSAALEERSVPQTVLISTKSILPLNSNLVDSVSKIISLPSSVAKGSPGKTAIAYSATPVVSVYTTKSVVPATKLAPVVLVEEQAADSTKSQTVLQLQSDSQSQAGPKELLKCEECEYSTTNKHYLKQHVDLVHSDVRPYKCPFCDYAGKRSHSLKEHLVVHSSDRPYECHLCNATFRKKGHLTNHIKMHSPPTTVQLLGGTGVFGNEIDGAGNIFICAQCEFASTSKTVLMKHLNSCSKKVGGDAGQSCESTWVTVKESESSSSKLLPTGIPSSSPNPPVVLMKCTECGFTSSDKDLLRKHMWIHIEQSSGSSSQKSSPVSDNLVKLEQTPVKEQAANTAFKCGECFHETTEAYKFIAHMLTHKASPKSGKAAAVVTTSNSVLVSTESVKETPASAGQSRYNDIVSSSESSGFTHDKSVGRFCCNICGYTCDHQRTIKAHVWKHSGHKDIDYPMFQNGPMSIYDDITQENCSKMVTNPPSASVKVEVCTQENEIQNNAKILNGVPTVDTSVVSEALMKLLGSKSSGLISNKSETIDVVTSLPLLGKVSNMVQVVLTESDGITDSHDDGENPDNSENITSKDFSVGSGAHHKVEPKDTDKSLLCDKSGSTVPRLGQEVLNSSPPKRPLPETTPSTDSSSVSVVQAAKRFCTGAVESSPNVVVERINAVSQSSTLTGLRSQQNSPRCPELLNSVDGSLQAEASRSSNMDIGDSETSVLSNELPFVREVTPAETSDISKEADSTNTDIVILTVSDGNSIAPVSGTQVWTQADISTLIASQNVRQLSANVLQTAIEFGESSGNQTEGPEKQCVTKSISVDDESALTLLSLLQKGSQNNVCDTTEDVADIGVQFQDCLVEVHEEQVVSVDEGSQTTDDNVKDGSSSTELEDPSDSNKPKAGICSSLLAVIEQLRERSKSESETDDSSQLNILGKRKPRRRNQRNSRDTPLHVETMENVEKLDEFEPKYRCKLCHYTNSSPQLIKQHMRLHKTKKPFECSLCDFVADSSETLQDHMIQHCKMRTYQCKLCPSAFNYKSQLRAHMRAHSEKDPFLCDTCDFETTNPITFRNHTRLHTDKNLLKCDSCGSFFSDKNDWAIHRRDGCKAEDVYFCEECTFETLSQPDLKHHQKAHRKQNLQCPHCDLICPSQSSYRVHVRAHEEAKDMKCELCNFLAASSRSLKSHMKRHINDQRYVQQPLEQYKCNLCGYVCHHLPSLKSHMWRHASDKNYIYEFTNEVINAAIDYDSRQDNTNTAAKTTVCDSKTDDVDMEEETDSSDSPTDKPIGDKKAPCLITFRCCQCGFETISKSDLNQHMKMHSDIIQKTLEVSKSLSQSGLSAKRVHLEAVFDSSPISQGEDSTLSG
ncbi:zinc finger protein 507-like [Liolophura sinensis]|uniref:zinc finger protein 507-like n=1 Tax=Liolophura sinensis TaxID=3198878 RepID=UPI0031585EFF